MVVLHQMKKQGYISQSVYDSLKVLPLDMSRFKIDSHAEGPAPYFRMELAKWLKLLLDRPEYRKPDGSKYNIYRDGLKIYTTIDLEMQVIAEEEMLKHMQKVQNRFWTIWKNRDPWTYQTDAAQKSTRQDNLKAHIRQTPRYQELRERIMGDVLERLVKDAGYQPSEWDIEIMLEEDKQEGRIARLVARKSISKERASNYRRVMGSEFWEPLRRAWSALDQAVEAEFNTPVSMEVYDYSDGMKQVKMSPLDSIKYYRKFLQTGILAIDPRSGQIKTWIGGVNHRYFQYDHIQASRQVGSTFKPFVYATAIALQGFSPCFPVVDQPYTIAPGDGQFRLIEPWTPQNADGQYTLETLTLYDCLRQSKNTCSVYLMQQLGNANVVRGLVHNMGIDSSKVRSDGEFRVPNQPSICLGSADLSVMEMTGAYATFANNGLYTQPLFVLTIEDEHGREIYRHIPNERQALPPKANYVMVDMLKYAGTNLGGITGEVGGKTGTTNDYVDGWFVGITPTLVVGTWVGGEDPWIRFLSLDDGQGSVMAKPFFREFIKRLQNAEDVDFDPKARFSRPPGDLEIEIDCEKYRSLQSKYQAEEFHDSGFFEDEFIEQQ
jgi:penicillin-binding protein 1A